jgi:CRP-like cAMP-binding protein
MKEYAYFHDEGTLPTELLAVPFLNSFTEDQLDDVLNSSSIMEAEPGDVIIEEGQIDSRFYILLSGELEVRVAGRLVAGITRGGDVFGELALVNQDKRGASVVVSKNAVCLAVDQKFLHDIRPREEDPAFHASLFEFVARLIAKKLDATSRRLAEVEKSLRQYESTPSAAQVSEKVPAKARPVVKKSKSPKKTLGIEVQTC